MRRLTTVLLIAIFVTLALSFSVLAYDASIATIRIENVGTEAGDTVDVTIEIIGNPGVASMGFTLYFDEGLKLVKAQNGEAFADLKLTPPAQLKSGGITESCRFAWLGNENITDDGPILHLQFEVDESMQINSECAISIACEQGDVLDEGRNIVNVMSIDGSVTIINYEPGDVDGNDKINMLDVLTLCQYYVDGCQYDPEGYGVSINESAGDVDGNSKINMLDVLTLCQYYVDGCQYDPEGYGVKLVPGKIGCNHTMKAIEAKEANCIQNGNIAYWYCEKCNQYFKDAIGKIKISFQDTIVPATGSHNYGDWIPEVLATCSEDGIKGHFNCFSCGRNFDENKNELSEISIQAFGHTSGEVIKEIMVKPKCTIQGSYDYVTFCSICRKEIQRTTIIEPAIGHKYDKWIPQISATCTTDGVLGHYHCLNCGDNFDENKNQIGELKISAFGHTQREPIEENRMAFSCTTVGKHDLVVYCSICNIEISRTTIIDNPATGHAEIIDAAVEVTCTEFGLTEGKHCATCGEILIRQIPIPKTGHIWNDDVCYVCGYERKPSQGLSFVSNGDGTCYVSGIGTCLDADVVIPNVSPAGDDVVSVGAGAFDNCDYLMSIAIKPNITSIGSYAFKNCIQLKSVTISSSVESMEKSLFYGCSSLKSIALPTSIISIGDYTFYGCTSLENIEIPPFVTSIGAYAFTNCSSLSSVKIPDTVMSIGSSAFEGCPIISATIPTLAYSFIKNNSLQTVVITSGKSIVSDAFSGCTSLKSITIPDSVTSIGSSAFYGCSSLISVTLPNSITSLGNSAFSGCKSLKSINIPSSVTSIGISCLSGCSALQSITIPFVGNKSGISSASPTQYPFGYLFGTNSYIGGTATIQFYHNDSSTYFTKITYYIPTTLKSVTVTGGYIPSSAFSGCSNITNVTIGNSVSNIGADAFGDGCTSLSSVTIKNGITSIGREVFYGCSTLKSISIPNSVTSIGQSAFWGCSSLTSITIPNSVSSIGDYAFESCSKLINITIGNGVTSIGKDVFSGCPIENATIPTYACPFIKKSSLKTVVITSGTSIDNYAFEGCSSLKSVTIKSGVKSIGNYAFKKCTSLTSVTIPNSVVSIGNHAFADSEYLTSITYSGTMAQWKQISRGDFWHYRIQIIYCTNGNITL